MVIQEDAWSVCGSGDPNDNTLVRENDVTQGSDWATSSAAETCQWEVLSNNTWTYIGSHPHNFGTICTDEAACNTGASAACEFPVESFDCDGNQLVDVTFNVDMSIEGVGSDPIQVCNGGSWNTMDDSDQDSIYSLTLQLAVNTVYTYNFYDGWYEGNDGECGAGQYGNDRSVTVAEDDIILDAFCWESCEVCPTVVTCVDSNATNTDNQMLT